MEDRWWHEVIDIPLCAVCAAPSYDPPKVAQVRKWERVLGRAGWID